jgi:hypothetical protein
MKYLSFLILFLCISCTKQKLVPGTCFVDGTTHGVLFYKTVEQSGNSFLIYSYSHGSFTTSPPVDNFKDIEMINCEIVEKALKLNKEKK